MKKTTTINGMIAALLSASIAGATATVHAQQPTPGQVTTFYGPGMNLITNPGHEHPGAYFAGRGEINVTWDWVPFWEEAPPGKDPRDQYYRTPEFRPPFARDYPERVKSGGGSDRWFNYFALNKKAGIMQYVSGVPFGATLRFTTWIQLWSSNENRHPAVSSQDGNLQVRLCIDQDGGPRNMDDPELKCSDWAQPYDKWAQLSVDAVAKNNVVNAIIWSRAAIPVEHNDIYADESCFEILSTPADKGICAGAGFVPTSFGVQPLPANYASISSTLPGPAAVAPAQPLVKAGASLTAPANDKPAATVNTTGNLNIRGEAKTGGKVLAKAPRGTVLDVTGKSADGKWYQVNYNGAKGWVSVSFVLANALAKASPAVQ